MLTSISYQMPTDREVNRCHFTSPNETPTSDDSGNLFRANCQNAPRIADRMYTKVFAISDLRADEHHFNSVSFP